MMTLKPSEVFLLNPAHKTLLTQGTVSPPHQTPARKRGLRSLLAVGLGLLFTAIYLGWLGFLGIGWFRLANLFYSGETQAAVVQEFRYVNQRGPDPETDYFIRFAFSAPDPGSGALQSFSVEQQVRRTKNIQLYEGAAVQIRYMPGAPDQAMLWGTGGERVEYLDRLFWSVIALLIPPMTIVGMLFQRINQRRRQAGNQRQHRLGAGRILAGEWLAYQAANEHSPIAYAQFRFRNPAGRLIRSDVPVFDVPAGGFAEAGWPVAVRYADDQTFELL
jgi:hypothetical protein